MRKAAVFAVACVHLAYLGGSPFYVFAGLLLVILGVLFAKGSSRALPLFAAVSVITIVWSLWESGLSYWGLVPRLSWILVLGLLVALVAPALSSPRYRRTSFAFAGLFAVILVAGLAAMFTPHDVVVEAFPDRNLQPSAPEPANEWLHYGNSAHGTRFSELTQVTPANVKDLKVAWTFHTDDISKAGSEDQNTPLFIGDTVLICTPFNKVIALDAETGTEKWRFDPNIFEGKRPSFRYRCRSLGYYKAEAGNAAVVTDAAPAAAAAVGAAADLVDCRDRVVMTTLDARLIELDPQTGKRCIGFGTNGEVDLKPGMGSINPDFYLPSSGPTVANGKIVVGGSVRDNISTSEPSGVVRAYDVMTGELAWAWDPGNPNITRYPPPGETYTRGSPNVWSIASADEKLGLVYVPTGNQTPDYYGAGRTPETEATSSSVVALDVASGKVRWKFQTTHHDLWDYDAPAQPVLYDLQTANGTVPALIQLTKSGQIYVLDRRTGTPVSEVKETPVPTNAPPGDWLSPTQPLSVAMPQIGTEPLSESRMWGATIIDQMLCRIEFKKTRYQGMFTPPGPDVSLEYPGNFGGFNWGSGSINERNGVLYVTDIRLSQRVQLVPRDQVEAIGKTLRTGESTSPQTGYPYAVRNGPLMSPLGIPCNQPPFGFMTAVDLVDHKVIWQRPIGTIEDTPLPGGITIPAQIPLGMPPLGGTMNTASGLVFFAGTQDYYLRAIDGKTGAELWKGRMPVGANATPMSYVSPKSGRQFVVINAGGAARTPADRGDLIIAYALPKP